MSLLSLLGLSRPVVGEPATFDSDYGVNLLHQNKFDEAAQYYAKHLEKNAAAHYGLALSKFRKNPANLSVQDLEGIAELLETAIALAPDFADAYFMCAMAYHQAAGLQLGSYNKNRVPAGRDAFQVPDAHLVKAERYFGKAIALNPAFSEIAEREMDLNQKLRQFSSKLKAEL
jgi:tetratricopeptide (TPR) repeat protein